MLVPNFELLNSVTDRWNPSDIAFIQSLHYRPTKDGIDSELTIEFLAAKREGRNPWPPIEGLEYCLTIRFYGIRQFHVSDFGKLPKQIMGFDIITSDSQWEDVHYEIVDYEHSDIGFFCREMEVVGAYKLH
jgi:hypothetical protein